ncbi:Sua5/YciO/YrdC/YwlC family protein [Pseudoxanthomonas sangjuensis]|uniref:Sua5/YciO/YrdC/YwlC family protein n=1 Tax=Pseudoxanthomonas sangjuensis TaxID=1503750 RepID=UPI0013919732|nr:Sua5/YciO/YrdC/YwlC family protein [Pseudoxanthomonas sangjuensis]KAF1714262.1 tRNA threonylcarbamoyladenosine biosynthesis protein RimN [Pseudoxanthomonas sangjuensis]
MPIPLSTDEAADRLREGAVVAYPTEGVWGLGCDPRDEAAVLRLLAIKRRPADKGLILIAADFGQLRPFVDIDALPADRLDAVRADWPGPHTWVMPASAAAPRWITGAHAGIAVRVSAHPPVVALCQAFGGALVSTSANLAGQPAPQRRDGLDPTLLSRIDGVLAGETGGLQRATPIRDALTGEALRA